MISSGGIVASRITANMIGLITPRFSPMNLFTSSSIGAFLDLSKDYARFQDAAGTTAATADAAPLGLVYDLKNGVPQLGASLTLLATTADKTVDGTTTVNVLATSGVVGKAVRVQFTVATITGSFTVSSTGTGGTSVTISSTGTYDIVVMAGATGGNIKFEGLTTSRFSVTGIVIKELPGSHAYQATTTARPLLYTTPYYYAKFDLGDDVWNTYLPAITNGTICLLTNKGAWFDTLNFAGGVFSLGPTTYTGGPAGLLTALRNAASDLRLIGMVVIDKALSAAEKASLVAWGRSKGCPGEIMLGSNIVTNGTFDSDLSGWTNQYSRWRWENGRAYNNGEGNGRLEQAMLTAGKSYFVTLDRILTSGHIYLRVGSGIGTGVILPSNTSGVGLRGAGIATDKYIQLEQGAISTSTCYVDNIIVQEMIFP